MEPNTNYKKVTFWERLAAYVIDSVLLLPALILVTVIIRYFHFNFPFITRLIQFAVVAVYNYFFIIRTGATIGKKILRLKVVSTNYENITIKQTLLREVIGKFISQIVFGIGFVWALGNGKKQTWHDKLAHTYVVKLNKEHNLISQEDKKPNIFERIILILYSLFIILSIILGLLYAFVAHPVRIGNNSMEPTYKKGAYLLVLNNPGKIKRYNVLTYTVYIKNKKQTFTRRVIALPDEKVGLTNSKIFINGKILPEKDAKGKILNTSGGIFLKNKTQRLVPKLSYFVMGDNRTASLDSRDMGFVPARNITGKVLMCYWNCK